MGNGPPMILERELHFNPYVLSSYAKEQLPKKRPDKSSHNDAHLMTCDYDTIIVPIVDNSKHRKDHVDGENLKFSVNHSHECGAGLHYRHQQRIPFLQ
jgi:hypothetical protein